MNNQAQRDLANGEFTVAENLRIVLSEYSVNCCKERFANTATSTFCFITFFLPSSAHSKQKKRKMLDWWYSSRSNSFFLDTYERELQPEYDGMMAMVRRIILVFLILATVWARTTLPEMATGYTAAEIKD